MQLHIKLEMLSSVIVLFIKDPLESPHLVDVNLETLHSRGVSAQYQFSLQCAGKRVWVNVKQTQMEW